MNEFRASVLVNIGMSLARFAELLGRGEPHEKVHQASSEALLKNIGKLLRSVNCTVAARAAETLANEVDRKPLAELQIKADVLKDTIFHSLDEHLFLWVPEARAFGLRQSALDIVGADAVARFRADGMEQEIEEALRCYGAGRFTACGFHLMRACEPPVRLFAKAIGRSAPLKNWGGLMEDWRRLEADRTNPLWASHKDTLWRLLDSFSSIKNAYRDRLAHGEICCDESEAKRLLSNIPQFVRQVADSIDSQGQFI